MSLKRFLTRKDVEGLFKQLPNMKDSFYVVGGEGVTPRSVQKCKWLRLPWLEEKDITLNALGQPMIFGFALLFNGLTVFIWKLSFLIL